jgi:thioesterase domain-containing protein
MVSLGHDRAAVIFTAHHIICDGWSLDVLIHDLCAFYSEEVSGSPVQLEPKESYRDYVQSVTDRQCSDDFKQAESYWRAKFSDGFPVLVLPTDHARRDRRGFRARRIDHLVPSHVVQGLRAVAAKQGCSFFAVLLSSLAILFARVSQQRRFVIALPTAEQPVSGQPGLVGHCVNLLPFAVELGEGEVLSAFIKRVQNELLAAQDHASFTMVSLLADLRAIAHAPGISAISAGFTNVKKFKPNELPQSGFIVDYDANPKGYESFEFYLNAVEREDNLELRCHYDVELFEDLTIREWLKMLGSIFQEFTEDLSRDVLCFAWLEHAKAFPVAEVVYTQISKQEAAQERSWDASASEPFIPLKSPGPPRNITMAEPELLQALLPLWQRVLSIHEIGPDDEFFALGGNSIAAAQLFALIQRKLGYNSPLATLYNASTPRMLARTLSRGSKPEDWKSLVAINQYGNRPPLFLMHAHTGNTLEYRPLANLLGPDQPVYTLQARGLDGHVNADSSLEEMATAYIEEIRCIQPRGPYYVGGFCFGGLLAIEAAQQLTSAGQEVRLVILIQSMHPQSMYFKPTVPHLQRWWFRATKRLSLELENLSYRGAGYFMERWRFALDRASAKSAIALGHVKVDGETDLSHMPMYYILEALANKHTKVASKYVPRSYNGDVVLFRSSKQLKGLVADEYLGWRALIHGNIDLCEIRGHQQNLLSEPNVRRLAKELSSRLVNAQREGPGNNLNRIGNATQDPDLKVQADQYEEDSTIQCSSTP